MRLSHYAVGRDNNFTLIRLAAAMTVLFAHSIGALGLPPDTEPVFRQVGFSLGEMGLDALFVTSGFLVTASLANRGDLVSFFWARALQGLSGALGHARAHGVRPRAGADDAAARPTITPPRRPGPTSPNARR